MRWCSCSLTPARALGSLASWCWLAVSRCGECAALGSTGSTIFLNTHTRTVTTRTRCARQVVFAHPLLSPHVGLVALSFLAGSVVHQLCFALTDPVPFALATAQDFSVPVLAAMASAVASDFSDRAAAHGDPDGDGAAWQPALLSTVVVSLCGSTLLLGVALLALARARALIGLMQLVPLPVVGGFLVSVALFLLKGGLGVASGVTLATFADAAALFEWHVGAPHRRVGMGACTWMLCICPALLGAAASAGSEWVVGCGGRRCRSSCPPWR